MLPYPGVEVDQASDEETFALEDDSSEFQYKGGKHPGIILQEYGYRRYTPLKQGPHMSNPFLGPQYETLVRNSPKEPELPKLNTGDKFNLENTSS